MKVYRPQDATTDGEGLRKRYRLIWEDIDRFERLLAADITTGHWQIPGLKLNRGGRPAEIYKAKVICSEMVKGKRAGYRYIYEVLDILGEKSAVGLAIYLHQDGTKEHDARATIRERFRTYWGEKEGMSFLERCDVD